LEVELFYSALVQVITDTKRIIIPRTETLTSRVYDP